MLFLMRLVALHTTLPRLLLPSDLPCFAPAGSRPLAFLGCCACSIGVSVPSSPPTCLRTHHLFSSSSTCPCRARACTCCRQEDAPVPAAVPPLPAAAVAVSVPYAVVCRPSRAGSVAYSCIFSPIMTNRARAARLPACTTTISPCLACLPAAGLPISPRLPPSLAALPCPAPLHYFLLRRLQHHPLQGHPVFCTSYLPPYRPSGNVPELVDVTAAAHHQVPVFDLFVIFSFLPFLR